MVFRARGEFNVRSSMPCRRSQASKFSPSSLSKPLSITSSARAPRTKVKM